MVYMTYEATLALGNTTNSLKGFGSVCPMRVYSVDTVSFTSILTKVGGFWSTISATAFFTLSLFLYQQHLLSQAKIIKQRQDQRKKDDDSLVLDEDDQADDQEEQTSLALIVSMIKERVSLVRIYELFDSFY